MTLSILSDFTVGSYNIYIDDFYLEAMYMTFGKFRRNFEEKSVNWSRFNDVYK